METNKIIAVFMGFEDESRILGGGQKMRRKTEWKYGCQQYEQYSYDQLKYHSDWNWLMSVVEKIEQTNEGCTLVIIEDERCHIDNQKGFEIDSVGHTKIEAVYNAVVRFVSEIN
jgi:hypothetical protein